MALAPRGTHTYTYRFGGSPYERSIFEDGHALRKLKAQSRVGDTDPKLQL